MPPPAASAAEQLASKLFLGPALRTQPDRRLVTLVREGYEAAFEEIVRRYRKPLDRFAASFVGGRSEDVCQDAFSKALLALRGSENEIELRPWLYRIVRNTALNDLRDHPGDAAELGEETLAGARSAAEEVERREELTELTDRLQALPEPQRAAIVMRELEGLSHEEIAAALGMSGGAARQAIYRGRAALRGGLGLLLPLPLLRLLAEHGASAAAGAGAGGAVAAAGAAGAAGGAAGTAGALGAAGTLKVGLATALIAGSVGAGVAVEQSQRGHGGNEAAARPGATSTAAAAESGSSATSGGSAPGLSGASSTNGDGRRNEGQGGQRGEDRDATEGHGGGDGDGPDPGDGRGPGGEGFAPEGQPPHSGPGHGRGGRGPDRGGHDGPGGQGGGPGRGPGHDGPGRGGQGPPGGRPGPSGGGDPRGGRQPGAPEGGGSGSGNPPGGPNSGSSHPSGGGPSGGGGSGNPGDPDSGSGSGGSGSPAPPPASPPPPEEGEASAPEGETEKSS